jgi:hypothetical protein
LRASIRALAAGGSQATGVLRLAPLPGRAMDCRAAGRSKC